MLNSINVLIFFFLLNEIFLLILLMCTSHLNYFDRFRGVNGVSQNNQINFKQKKNEVTRYIHID